MQTHCHALPDSPVPNFPIIFFIPFFKEKSKKDLQKISGYPPAEQIPALYKS
jgi:hypothetical protein